MATPLPVPRPASPPALARLRRRTAQITIYSCRSLKNEIHGFKSNHGACAWSSMPTAPPWPYLLSLNPSVAPSDRIAEDAWTAIAYPQVFWDECAMRRTAI